MADPSEGHDETRRNVVRSLGFGALAAAVLVNPGSSARAAEETTPGYTVTVHRLRTRGTKACHACRMHHRYTVFTTRIIADTHRAHVGCNCPIVTQKITRRLYKRLFPRGSDGVAKLPRGESIADL